MEDINLTPLLPGFEIFENITLISFNPQAVGMAVARSEGFEIDSRGHFTANEIQNATNVKFGSLGLIFNFNFYHKLFSSLKITYS